jgi:MoxR-like ATPase
VILLDEIDRAHQAIQDILLSMLEGEGKDGQNQTVYFSQAIFILTTNLGQDQVNAGYARVSRRFPRDQIARHFNRVLEEKDALEQPDALDQRDTLRELILAGAVDETERRMQLQLDADVLAAKRGFDSQDPEQRLRAIRALIDLRDLRQSLERTARRSAFDAAFLDRVDFVVPMLPIAEPDLIEQIVDLNLRQADWRDCPHRDTIIRRTIAHAQGVRIIGRLIESLRDADFATAFQTENADAD